jgi:hypothetical protein
VALLRGINLGGKRTLPMGELRALLERLGLDEPWLKQQMDVARWPEAKRVFAAKFKTGTQAEWTRLLALVGS